MLDYDRLREAVENSGKTKRFLSGKCGRPQYWLNDILRVHSKIPPEELEILAEECNVSIDWLNGVTDNPERHEETIEELLREILPKLATRSKEELKEVLDLLGK